MTPEELERLVGSSQVIYLFQQLEEDILSDMARRMGKADFEHLTDTAKWQLYRLRETRLFRSDLIRRLSRITGQSDAAIRRLLSQAGTLALRDDDRIHRLAGKHPVPVNDSPALRNLLTAGARQTSGSLFNITATTADTATHQFERALDRAWMQVSSGAFDYQTAIRRGVDDLARQGVQSIVYPTGHVDTLEVAVRRAVLTGVNQSCAKLQMERMDEVGCAFVETTVSVAPRPEHAKWQGKVFHRGGAVRYKGVFYPDFVSSTGYGTGPGLCGWNCHHRPSPFWPGLSRRNYTDDQLREMTRPVIAYDGQKLTRYEASQKQRALERKVRKYKRQFVCEDAAGLDTTQSAVKLKAAREQLKEFAYATGGRVDSARTGTHEFGRSAAGKATWTAEHHHTEWLKSIGAEKSQLNTLAKYYEGKYTNSPAYQTLMQYSRSVKSGMLSPLTGFDLFKAQVSRVEHEVIGQVTSNGITVKGITEHFPERMFGTAHDPTHGNRPRSGVSVDDILDAVLHGKPRPVRYTKDRKTGGLSPSQKFVTDVCDVTINPETGYLIQCNPA